MVGYRLACLLALVACRLDERITVALPDLESARSMIVALESDTGLYVYAQAISPRTPLQLPIGLESGGSGRIDIVTYQVDLDVIGIEGGPLAHVETEPSRPLPAAFRHFVVDVQRGSAGPVEMGGEDGPLATFRIAGVEVEPPPPAPECLPLSSEQINLEGERMDRGWSGFEVAVSPTVVLIGTANHEVFRVGSTVERLAIDPAEPAITAGAIDDDGRLWFADSDGTLWRGELGAGLHLELVATSTIGPIDVLAVGRDGDRTEAFAVTLASTLARFDGDRWRVLHRFCVPPGCDLSSRFDLERLGPNEAIAMKVKGRTIVHYRDGAVIEMPVMSSAFARCVESIEGFGTLVGTENGELLRFDGGWQLLVKLDTAFEIYAVAPHPAGLLLGSKGGGITQYIPSGPACPVELLGATDVERFVPWGDAFIAVGELSDTANALPLTVIRFE